jgi:hypothetical protein
VQLVAEDFVDASKLLVSVDLQARPRLGTTWNVYLSDRG